MLCRNIEETVRAITLNVVILNDGQDNLPTGMHQMSLQGGVNRTAPAQRRLSLSPESPTVSVLHSDVRKRKETAGA